MTIEPFSKASLLNEPPPLIDPKDRTTANRLCSIYNNDRIEINKTLRTHLQENKKTLETVISIHIALLETFPSKKETPLLKNMNMALILCRSFNNDLSEIGHYLKDQFDERTMTLEQVIAIGNVFHQLYSSSPPSKETPAIKRQPTHSPSGKRLMPPMRSPLLQLAASSGYFGVSSSGT